MTGLRRDRRAAAATTWDALAARYRAQEQLEHRAVDVALRLAAPEPHQRLVDLATGTGLLLRRLAARPARPREAIGVDRSAGMLARVGDLPHGWSTVLGDARQVVLPSGCADVVTCSYLLHLLDRAERADVLAEAKRLLAASSASRLITVTVWADDACLRGRLISRALRAAARARPAPWGGLRPLDPSADLAAAGFVVTRRVVLPRRGYPSLVIAAVLASPAAEIAQAADRSAASAGQIAQARKGAS